MKDTTILVIDDDDGILLAFKTYLSAEFDHILAAEDCASARQIITDRAIDVIVADIVLDDGTGIDILKQVKKKNARIPVIMITGAPDIETSSDAVRLGAFDYLTKPISREKLIRVTRLALNQKHLADEKERLETEKEHYRLKLEAIFRSIRDAVITVDENRRIIAVNDAAESIFRIPVRNLLEKNLTDFSHSSRKACLDVLDETLTNRTIVREYEVECKQPSGAHQVLLLTSSPLVSSQGRFRGAVLVVRDITRLTDLEQELHQQNQFQNIVGSSPALQDIFRLLQDLTDTDTTVLITGESGTGKELVARALHYTGIRSEKNIVSVNCSALAENLLESELFGHVRGAFTGAVRDKIGRFQLADGGTLFLDEIGDISLNLQVKLLRVLQDRTFERVGDVKPIKVDTRVVAATNRNLREMVQKGTFREDLYYRLKVVEIAIPPLRERREDIPLLVDHFRQRLNDKYRKQITGVSEGVLNVLMNYSWPGNIRELEHTLEHAFVLCHGRSINHHHLPVEIREFAESLNLTSKNRKIDEPEIILGALAKTDWNKAKAARLLGISRQTMYRKLRQYAIQKPLSR